MNPHACRLLKMVHVFHHHPLSETFFLKHLFASLSQEYVVMGLLISLFAGHTQPQEKYLFLVLLICHGWKMVM